MRTPYRRNRLCRVILAAGLVFTSCLPGSSPAVAAVQAASDAAEPLVAEMLRQGFTRADFAALRSAQIAPHYTLYASLLRCRQHAAGLAVANSADLASGIAFFRLMCVEPSEALRASLAREIGLDRAERVRLLLGALAEYGITRAWPNQAVPKTRAGSRKLSAPVQIGRWLIKPAPGGCRADYLGNGRKAPRAAMVQDGKTIQLWLGSEEVLWTADDPPPLRIVTIKQPAGSSDLMKEFALKYEPGVIWLHARMSESELADLSEATELGLAIRGPNFGNPRDHDELFAFAPIALILDTLRDC